MTLSTSPFSAAASVAFSAKELEGSSPQDILVWALTTYGARLTLACSFGGASGMVLLDMAMKLDADIPVFYLDTGFLFPETYESVRVAERHYGFTARAVRAELSPAEQAAQHGEALWERDPDRCCALRKVEAQRAYLDDFDAWITGLRRDQGGARGATPVVQWDHGAGLTKVNPLVSWDERAVWTYIAKNNVPYNALLDRGYPSIGCTHCTRPVAAGEDPRAGRWSGFNKTECGLHAPVETLPTPYQQPRSA